MCRLRKSLSFGLHLTEKTSWTSGWSVSGALFLALVSLVDCKGVGRLLADGMGCHCGLGMRIGLVFLP